MQYQYIHIDREARMTTITIDRPTTRNALNSAAHLELAAAFDEYERDDGQWVAIITGAGDKAFCAGHDLKQQAAGGGMETPKSGFAGLTGRTALLKPVIAAVNGVAMGGGFELALACDLIVATESASFSLPEPRVGLAALAGALQRLPRDIGIKRAMGLMLTGRRISAEEGRELGFVNEVCSGDCLPVAKRWAAEILSCSPLSIRATKHAVLKGLLCEPVQGIADAWQYPSMQRMLNSEDAQEGPLAFLQKRPPQWKGR